MRKVLSVVAIALVSSVPLLAQQAVPPPSAAPRPSPATAPTTPLPPNVKAPSVTPRTVTVPPGRSAASIPAPEVGFATSQVAAQGQQGQTPRPGQNATPAPPAAASTVSQATSWQNVAIEVTILDWLTADMQTKKTVSMLILDGRSGQVRSSNEGYINIDASPSIRPDGRIYLRLTVAYLPYLTAQQSQQTGNTVGRTDFSESLSVVVNDGKPITLSQAADPRGDRKVSLQVTASVIK